MPKNAIVVGMARSGTSLAAAIFARKGYHIGAIELPHMREGDDHNPFGYFEADDLVRANAEILGRAGHPYLNSWAEPQLVSDESAARIEQFLPTEAHQRTVERYGQHAPWIWKDPRLCYTLSYWWKLMDPGATRVLLVHRDPMEIFRSFQRMAWCEPGDSRARDTVLECAELHLTAARRAIASLGIPHVEVQYADYRNCPAEVARRLADCFDLDLTVADLNFHPELNHSTLRGRVAAGIRNHIRSLPRRPIRQLERLIPRRLVSLIFPERYYTDDRAALSRANGR